MTKPGSTNQITLSPEGQQLAMTLAKKAGLPPGTVAPNARVVSRYEISDRDGVHLNSMAHPEGPRFEIVNGVLKPLRGAVLQDLRLGMSVHYGNGVPDRWTIVVRRDGVRLCDIDYADEETCEQEQEKLRALIDAHLVSDVSFEMWTKATAIRNYNSTNGQEL